MKKLLILLLSALSLTVYAQQKKVAVYVTGDDPINGIMGDHLVDAIAHSGKYIAVERTASFLAELGKEQNYQRTGSVDDSEISRLGIQFGVSYVCVATPFDLFGGKYISARMIDVERAEVIATSSAMGAITNSTQFLSVLNNLTKGLLQSFEQSKMPGAKKVAVYVTRTGNKDIDIILGDQLVAGFAASGRYLAIERTQGFLDQLSKEKNYQETGAVSDEELMRLGRQFGVQYVCVAQTSVLFGDYYIAARLIDLEHGEVVNSYKKDAVQLDVAQKVVSVSQAIAFRLSNQTLVEYNKIETAFGIELKMVLVEGGDFLMGCTSEQGDCDYDVKKVRRVVLDDFYMGIVEVTQSQWEKVMGTSITHQLDKGEWKGIYGIGPDYPMYCISWDEAKEFCRLLSNETGKNYTLPTEAQWEYAARGGNKHEGTKYAGSNLIDSVAWYKNNSGYQTHIVSSKTTNVLGLYDMSGNVSEWCNDYSPSSSSRVVRGGCFFDDASDCRLAVRHTYPHNGGISIGFRVVCLP